MIKGLTALLDFFIPRICPACNCKLTLSEQAICSICISKFKRVSAERLKHEFERKFANDNFISGYFSIFIFEKDKEIQHLLHSLKYNGNFGAGKFLGETLAQEMKNIVINWNINSVIPIPLHRLKKIERGYNQSYFIAKSFCKSLKLSLDEKSTKRIKYTTSQTALSLIERKANIENAFAVKKGKKIAGKNILLIDDVITTGATTSECAKALIGAGANKIFAASIALAD